MKRLIILLLVMGFLFSCKKFITENLQQKFLKIEFEVGEQTDMQKYTIENSTDAKNFEENGKSISADPNTTKYSISVEVTKYFTISNNTVYTRIKGISNNGHIDYSPIIITQNQ